MRTIRRKDSEILKEEWNEKECYIKIIEYKQINILRI